MSDVAAPIGPVVDPDQLRTYMTREVRYWGGRIQQRREDLGFSRPQLADLAGTTVQTIHKIEQGELSPRDHLRVALAFALLTEVDRLFPMPSRETILRELDKQKVAS